LEVDSVQGINEPATANFFPFLVFKLFRNISIRNHMQYGVGICFIHKGQMLYIKVNFPHYHIVVVFLSPFLPIIPGNYRIFQKIRKNSTKKD